MNLGIETESGRVESKMETETRDRSGKHAEQNPATTKIQYAYDGDIISFCSANWTIRLIWGYLY